MRTIDRIRNYLQEQKNAGVFSAGDRLPSYHELMKIGQGSYATVMNAMKCLQTETCGIRNAPVLFFPAGTASHLHSPQTQVLPERSWPCF